MLMNMKIFLFAIIDTLLIILLLLMALCISTTVWAEEPIQVPLSIHGNPNDLITIDGINMNKNVELNRNGDATIAISYNEPGNYIYLITDKSTNVSIKALVYITRSEIDDTLQSTIVASKNGIKTPSISFENSTASSNSPTSSFKPISTSKNISTGISSKKYTSSLMIFSCAGSFLLGIGLIRMKKHD